MELNEQALKNLRKAPAECPSDLDLHQLYVGELLPKDAAALAAHVVDCARCQAQMTERKAGFAAYPELKAQPLLASIKNRLQKEAAARKSQQQHFLRRAVYLSTPLLAVAALCIVLLGRNGAPPDSALNGVREKGGLALYVYKFAGNHSEQTASGDHFKVGEKVRFVVDLPISGHINVLGVEASGEVYVAWPRSQEIPTLRGAGKLQELPGTGILDDSGGRETLYLIHCPAAVGPPASVCQTKKVRQAGAPPTCPSECAIAPFVLNKDKS